MQEDLSLFFHPTEFACTAEHINQVADRQTLTGIFETPSQDRSLSGLDFTDTAPSFLLPASQATMILEGDLLSLNDQTYLIIAPPVYDGTGLATLLLSEPSAHATF